MLNNVTLRTIQSGTLEEVSSEVFKTALYMATGGFLQHANKLLQEHWKHHFPQDDPSWLPYKSFLVLWDAAGVIPNNVPISAVDMESIERNQRRSITLDKWSNPFPGNDWKELTGTDLLRKAYKTAALEKANPVANPVTLEQVIGYSTGTNKENEHLRGETGMDAILKLLGEYSKQTAIQDDDAFPSPQKELLALDMLRKYTDDGNYNGDALSLAAELAARNGLTEDAITFAKLWAQNFHGSTSFRLSTMSLNRHVAPLLLQHILADELFLSEQSCASFLEKIIAKIEERIQNGRSLTYGDFTWSELLKKLSILSIKDAPDEYDEKTQMAEWLGTHPADYTAIVNTEDRLGVTLPKEYKDFLSVSNGFQSFSVVNPSLLPVEEIDYLKNREDPDLFKLYAGYEVPEDDTETMVDYVERCILVSKIPEEQMIWLIAPKEENGNWETWFFANWLPGFHRYPSFRYFMEEKIMDLDKD